MIYCELETLDRAQASTFFDPPDIAPDESENKLWYYYVTLAKTHHSPDTGPRYFVWLLVLPDIPVEPYLIWDLASNLGFCRPESKQRFTSLILNSPYQFYDPLIKCGAREFLTRRHKLIWFKNPGLQRREWIAPASLQNECELVFITMTTTHLVLSRGRDLFDPNEEQWVRLRWS